MKLFLIELHHQVYAKLKLQSHITAQRDKTIKNTLKKQKKRMIMSRHFKKELIVLCRTAH